MVEPLQLAPASDEGRSPMGRLNRLPIFIVLGVLVLFAGIVVYGLSSRGLRLVSSDESTSSSRSASRYGDQLTKGVPDGIIGEPDPIVIQPSPIVVPESPPPIVSQPTTEESKAAWRVRLNREADEQLLRELQRQRMASLQADQAAYDSPIGVSLEDLAGRAGQEMQPAAIAQATKIVGSPSSAAELYSKLLAQGSDANEPDPNGQAKKLAFLEEDATNSGYLANSVVEPRSKLELKRGSVIPATLITGINSDLPGRIIAQVSQNVFDSASGRYLLIPQGSKLLGRYDSEVTFGQSRVLVVWTDIILPNGSTLQLGSMAGTDEAGFGGLRDREDKHLLETFGSAILVAILGVGTDRNGSTSGQGASNDPLQGIGEAINESFSDLSNQSTSRNMNVQPTLEIRAGYRFNVLVDQDMTFSSIAN